MPQHASKPESTNVTTQEFLKGLFNEGVQINFFACREDGGRGVKDLPTTFTHSWLNKALDDLLEYNSNGFGVYFVVNSGGTKDRDITKVNAHYMEIDDIPLQEQWEKIMAFPLPPTFVVYSGGKSYHTYWLVKDAEIVRFRNIQQGLIKHFGADRSIINEARKMRLPGYFNRKPQNNKPCEVYYCEPGNVYTQDELEAILPSVEERQDDKISPKERMSKAKRNPNPLGATRKTDLPEYDKFMEMVTGKLEEAKYNARDDKTQCRCIMPEHNDNNPSAVLFWQTRQYFCPSCDTRLRIEKALEIAGGFEIALDYAEKHFLFASTDQANIIEKLGYGWDEYTQNIRRFTAEITANKDDILLAPVALSGKCLSDVDREVADTAAMLTIETLERRNGIIKPNHARDIKRISRLFAYSGHYDKAVPISGQPGLAKTTLLKVFCKEKVNSQPDAGIVIVCRTKQDMHEMASYLNGFSDIDGNPIINIEGFTDRKIAYVMQSWAPDPAICFNKKMRQYGKWFPGMCSKENCKDRKECTLVKQYGIQKKYPVVVMSHERLLMDSEEGGNFAKFYGTWEDYPDVYSRGLVIIDEKPDFIRETLLNHYTITRLTKKVKEAADKRMTTNGQDYSVAVREIEQIQHTIELIAKLQQSDTPMQVEFTVSDYDVCIPFSKGLMDFVRKYIGVEENKLLTNIGHMLKAGYCHITKHHGLEEGVAWQIGTARRMPMDIKDMNLFILDGTSDISADYADRTRFARYDCSGIRSYNNWTIKWVKNNLSQQKLSKQAEEINVKLASIIKERMVPHHKQILAVTLKDNKTNLERSLKDEIDSGTVVVQYDGNLIGTNEYKNFTCVAFTSRIEMPPALYLAKASLISQVAGGNIKEGTEDSFRFANRWYYHSEFIEAVKLLSMAESIVQGILRINRDPNSQEKVEVWLFDRNPLLIEMIEKKLTDCRVEVVQLEEFKSRRTGAAAYSLAQTAAEMLKELPDGRLSKSQLRERLGISKRALADNLSREDVKHDLNECGIKVSTRYFEWAC